MSPIRRRCERPNVLAGRTDRHQVEIRLASILNLLGIQSRGGDGGTEQVATFGAARDAGAVLSTARVRPTVTMPASTMLPIFSPGTPMMEPPPAKAAPNRSSLSGEPGTLRLPCWYWMLPAVRSGLARNRVTTPASVARPRFSPGAPTHSPLPTERVLPNPSPASAAPAAPDRPCRSTVRAAPVIRVAEPWTTTT